jgi:hypothetical protein
MLRGKIPPSNADSYGILAEEVSLHRFYRFYKLKPYMFVEVYRDINFMFSYYRYVNFLRYKSYSDVKFRKYSRF